MISVLKDNVHPLHKALVKSNIEVVKLFLERSDVDINMKSSYGFTALILAAGSIYLYYNLIVHLMNYYFLSFY